MTTPPYLGPRAAFLLALLTGRPRTVDEIAAIADRGISVFEELVAAGDFPPLYGSPAIALRTLADGGPEEIRRLLVRLEGVGRAGRVTVDDVELWFVAR